jgi:CspA family cold shock protein
MRDYLTLGAKHAIVIKMSRCLVETASVQRLTAGRRKVLEQLLSQKTGIVGRWFNGEGGYGFIHPDDGGEAVFVHHTGIAAHTKTKSLKEGVRVSYEVVRRKMAGAWAKDVCTTD